ncbi:MAG: hypothetical protein V2A58_11690 [Planctomycetota bacterium]
MAEKKVNVVEQVVDVVIGAVDYSADRVAKVIDGLIERGKVSHEEAAKILKDMSDRGRVDREKIRQKLHEALESTRQVSRSEFDELKKRVESLEKKSGC